jgi:hypothetical protein
MNAKTPRRREEKALMSWSSRRLGVSAFIHLHTASNSFAAKFAQLSPVVAQASRWRKLPSPNIDCTLIPLPKRFP